MAGFNLLQMRISGATAEAQRALLNIDYSTLTVSPEVRAILELQGRTISAQEKEIDELRARPFDFGQMLLQGRPNNYNSRKDVDLHVSFNFPHSGKEGSFIPVMAANMDTTGTLAMADALRKNEMFTCVHKHYETRELSKYFADLRKNDQEAFEYFAISTGISDKDYSRTTYLMEKNPEIQYVCVDVANGYLNNLPKFLKKFRNHFPDTTIFAGNVMDGERTVELIEAGADMVKVGIGPGSACTTRQETGVGALQGSAVVDCAYALEKLGYGYIMSDGGCGNVGNIAHAFAAGAGAVMLGGMFAGHKESLLNGTQIITDDNGKQWAEFHGMSSYRAMKEHYLNYDDLMKYRASEGRDLLVEYKGSVENTIHAILGGLRSAVTYTGTKGLHDLKTANYQIIDTNNNGLNLSLASKNPHFALHTKPNERQCTR